MKSTKVLLDQYVDLTRQIKALEMKQQELAEEVKARGVGRYEGTSAALKVISAAGRNTTNWAGVCAEAGIAPAVVAKYTTKGPDTLRLTVVL